MCFHSKQSQQAQTLEQRFKAKVKDTSIFTPSDHYHGFTHPYTPIIAHTVPEIIDHYAWGLVPAWAKDESIRRYTLNAKIETIHEKPSFRQVAQQRCLVLADGFYEWQWLDSKGKNKQKYLLHLAENAPFAYAGLWSAWQHPSTHETLLSYTIVTTAAQGIMKEIHNSKQRMPVILSPEQEQAWLQGNDLGAFKKPEIELLAKAMD